MVDNYELWQRNEQRLEDELAKCPVCSWCGEPIQDEYLYEVDGELLDEICMDKLYRKPTSDFMR